MFFYYFQRFFILDTANLRLYFSSFPLVFILLIPVLTMKSWAEENRLGSIEILFTMPFTEAELAFGKYLSCMALLAGMFCLTVPVPLTLLPLGYFDAGVILAEYTGAALLASTSVAAGLFISSISRHQAAAFLGSAIVLLVVMLIHNFSHSLPPQLAGAVNYVSLAFRFESFSRGLLDTRNVLFFALTTALFLFLNIQVLIFKRWK
jgi:ABC-2 type transport system permease protein